MKRFRTIGLAGVLVVVPAWSAPGLVAGAGELQWREVLANHRIGLAESQFLVHAGILVVWALLVIELLRLARPGRGAHGAETVGLVRRWTVWLTAGAALTPVGTGPARSAQATATVPLGTVVSPAIAATVLSHILRRRREQALASISTGGAILVPDRLTPDEQRALGAIRSAVRDPDQNSVAHQWEHVAGTPGNGPPDTDNPLVASLLAGVERLSGAEPAMAAEAEVEWRVVVKVFGHPTVTARNGADATFRKRRSLELLTWLVLNPDRQLRSAARTALWDVDVSDSTFSTIVSDMRRALSDLSPDVVPGGWCPPTYSDEIPLNPAVVTDAALLAQALVRFKAGEGCVSEIVELMSGVRDVPFAGTSYSWADLDGTTTRLVILAMDATVTLARWGREHGRDDVVTTATAAGLRVMPGCEELLDIQDELTRTRRRRVALSPRR